jgi:hypothetical protein
MTIYYASPTGNDSNNGLSIGAPKTVSGAVSAAGNGDTVTLAAGNYAGPLTITTKTNLTITCAKGSNETSSTFAEASAFPSGHPARFVRQATFNRIIATTCTNLTIQNVKVALDVWPGTGQQWSDIGRSGSDPSNSGIYINTCTNTILDGVQYYGGYGASFVPYDVTYEYPEYSYPNINLIFQQPAGIYANAVDGVTIKNCLLTDVGDAIKVFSGGAGGVQIDSNWIASIYSGSCTVTQSYVGEIAFLYFTRNVAWNTGFGKSSDGGYPAFTHPGPHADVFHHYSNIQTANYANRQRNVDVSYNLVGMQPNCRGTTQRIFLQGVSGSVASGVTETYVGAHVTKNILVTNPDQLGINVFQCEEGYIALNYALTTQGADYAGLPSAISALLQTNKTLEQAGITAVLQNITERYSSTVNIDQRLPNVTVGAGGTPYSSIFPNSANNATDASLFWNAFVPANTSFSLASSLNTFLTAALDRSWETCIAGVPTKIGSVPSILTVSDITIVRGGTLGSSVAVVPSAGLDWRQLDDDKISNPTAWSSTSGTILIGKSIQVRHTTAAGGGQSVTRTYTVAGQSFNYTTTNASIINIPRARMNGSTNALTKVAPGITYGVNTTQQLSFVMRMRMNTSALQGRLWRRGPDTGNNITINCSGSLNQLSVTIAGPSNVPIFSATSNVTYPFATDTIVLTGVAGTFANGDAVTGTGITCTVSSWNSGTSTLVVTKVIGSIINGTVLTGPSGSGTVSTYTLSAAALQTLYVSLDLSTNAFNLYFDDTNGMTSNVPTFNSGNGPIALNSISTFDDFFVNNGSVNYASSDFEFLWIAPSFIDFSDASKRALFSAAYIGPNGEGPLGSAPPVFVVGDTTALNAGTSNRGTGGALTMTGSATNVVTAAWPPVLDLNAQVTTVSPYITGNPINFLVFPLGYAQSFILTPSSNSAGTWSVTPVNVSAGIVGASLIFTPSAAASANITFTNNVSYNNPSPILLTINSDGRVTISPGSSATITVAQLLTLVAVTTAANTGVNIGPTNVRWNRLTSEIGPQDGLDITFNIT